MRLALAVLSLGLLLAAPVHAQKEPASPEAPSEASAHTPAEPASPPVAERATTAEPSPATTSEPRPPAEVQPFAAARQKAKVPWTGPRVELSYRIYSLTDSGGGGGVNSVTFAGYLPTRLVRAGGGVEAGARAYEYGPTEGLLSGHLFAGYQHLVDLAPVVPYVVVLGELGVLFGKRFHTPDARMLRGAGIEIGADVNVVRSLYVGLGLSYMLYTIDGLAYDSFGLRLSMGL